MLGAYNVNGAPCELLVEQDALTWWPKSWPTAATGGDGSSAAHASTSPLKQHLRRLSNASSVIFNSIGQLGHDDDNEDKTSDTQQQRDRAAASDRTKNKRRIEFSQIVGLRPILHGHHSSSSSSDKSAAAGGPARRRTTSGGRDKVAGQQSDSSESKTTISDESSQASQREQQQQQQQPPTEKNFIKFKLYYVKRNEKKATGRLLKLKKVSIGPLAKFKARHDTLDRVNSNLSSIENSIDSANQANRREDASAHLAGLYEQIEQHLELVRRQRPKRLLVFVNPFGGKGRALHLYKSKVRKVLELAQVECELVVTKYANHARETIEDSHYDLSQFDGIICIGGDGMFAELMNGLLFRCNRDKLLLASELGSHNGRLSDTLSSSGDSTKATYDNDAQQQQQQQTQASNHLQQQQQQQLDRHYSQQNQRNTNHDTSHSLSSSTTSSGDTSHCSASTVDCDDGGQQATGVLATATTATKLSEQQQQQLKFLRSSLGGIGEQFATPNIPIGVIGAGSTDANLFGFIGTNDTVSATLNIVMGRQIQIDVCSIHSIQDDRLLRFVSTFVAYGYFGDVIRESEKFRWLGPSRYDLTALNSLIKYRHYQGLVRILRSSRDGSPFDLSRCHLNCRLCGQQRPQEEEEEERTGGSNNNNNNSHPAKIMPNSVSFDEAALAKLRACDEVEPTNGKLAVASAGGHVGAAKQLALLDDCDQFEIVEAKGPFVGVNAAVTACRCPQTRKGFSPGNHLANGCADLILVRPCSRMQYINYLIRTGYTKKSAFDLKYVDAYRCRQFEFIAQPRQQRRRLLGGTDGVDDGGSGGGGGGGGTSSWNADGEILREESLRVKVNNRLLRVFGTGEPQRQQRAHKQLAKS